MKLGTVDYARDATLYMKTFVGLRNVGGLGKCVTRHIFAFLFFLLVFFATRPGRIF